jgi:hypothetical protein
MYKPLANLTNKKPTEQHASANKPTIKRHSEPYSHHHGKIRKRYNKRQREIHRYIRIGIGLATALIAVTAIAGGISMFKGSDEYGFPLAWLDGTIFTSYLIPSIALTVFVGGSCLAASITNFSHRRITFPISIVAGIMLCSFVLTEAIVLKNIPERPIVLEVFYFVWGLAILMTSTYLFAIKHTPTK